MKNIDPKALRSGTRVRHRSGSIAVITERKASDDGWWVDGGGGLGDSVILSDDWTVLLTDSLHDTMVRYGWTKEMIGAAMDAAALRSPAASTP